MSKLQLPNDFIANIEPVVGADVSAFVDALADDPITSVRLNDRKAFDASFGSDVVPWCDGGYYLPVRPRFTADPLFHAGCYYVQEASSMFLYQALVQCVNRHGVVLDMCAAPGGKSTLISSFLADDALLFVNEYVPQRAHILVENMAKWGASNVVVTNNAPIHYEVFANVFDAVCVDAPCSGEGMFRKDEKAVAEWSVSAVAKCVERQRGILHSAWQALKPGGVLVYSTCTYNRYENEENVQWLMDEYGAEFVSLEVDAGWNILVTDRGYRFMPHLTRGEGLFLSVVRKPFVDFASLRFKLPKRMPQVCDRLLDWLIGGDVFSTAVLNNMVYAYPTDYKSMVLFALERLNVLNVGVALAEVKGKDFVPRQMLALCVGVDRSKFEVADIEYDTAIAYLKAEAVQLAGVSRGFVLLTYKDVALGWVKNVGNRCNNLYPSMWRIRF